MKINGYRIQQNIRELKAKIDVLNAQLQDALKAFPGEEKPSPVKLTETIIDTEKRLVQWQCIQVRYNEIVTDEIDDFGVINLNFAVKIVGSLGRVEKFWRGVASPKFDRYASHYDNQRSKDSEYAQNTVSFEEAHRQHTRYSAMVSNLRTFIAQANVVEVDIDGLTSPSNGWQV